MIWDSKESEPDESRILIFSSPRQLEMLSTAGSFFGAKDKSAVMGKRHMGNSLVGKRRMGNSRMGKYLCGQMSVGKRHMGKCLVGKSPPPLCRNLALLLVPYGLALSALSAAAFVLFVNYRKSLVSAAVLWELVRAGRWNKWYNSVQYSQNYARLTETHP